MDIKLALINLFDILLRVPSLFLLDEIFQSNLSDLGLYPSSLLPLHKEADFDFVTGESNHTLVKPYSSKDNYDPIAFGNLTLGLSNVIEYGISTPFFSYLDWIFINGGVLGILLQLFLLLSGILFSLFTLTLWTKHMVKMYSFLFSVFLINVSYRCNHQASINLGQASIMPLRSLLNLDLVTVFESIPAVFYVLWNIASQAVLASGYLFVHSKPSIPMLQGMLALSFIIPSFTVMLPLANNPVPMWGLILLSAHAVFVICFKLPKVYAEVKDRICYVVAVVRVEGVMTFVETEWLRLSIPSIFRAFWFIRSGIYFYVYAASAAHQEWDAENLIPLAKIILVRGCETLPSILGMSAIFAWISSKTYGMCQKFLLIPNEEVAHVGPVSGVLFIILAFQNGLSTLKPAARIVRLLRNVFLLIACFLHFIHNAVDPVLMSLAASANPDYSRHMRALSIYAVLTFVTLSGLSLLWSTHLMSTWLLAVSGFSIEVVSKVVISLTLYALFLADAKFNDFWDKLDDYVYCVRCVGRALEFLVGLFLLCNSAFILVFESGGAIRAVLVGLHAYFNLWCEARVGWNTFTRRRTAVHKIATLDTVSSSVQIDDVCAICFNDLRSASPNVTVKVTPCRHYFHDVCLRKWLYIQDRCPMCHQTLWPPAKTTSEAQIAEEEEIAPHQE